MTLDKAKIDGYWELDEERSVPTIVGSKYGSIGPAAILEIVIGKYISHTKLFSCPIHITSIPSPTSTLIKVYFTVAPFALTEVSDGIAHYEKKWIKFSTSFDLEDLNAPQIMIYDLISERVKLAAKKVNRAIDKLQADIIKQVGEDVLDSNKLEPILFSNFYQYSYKVPCPKKSSES